MFDPNQPLPDFQTQSAEIQRQRLIAEMLRKQSGGQPQGKMVGKQYIAPNLMEYLPGLLNQYDAGQISRKADTAEKQYGSEVATAKENWTSSLPRAVAAVPGRVALAGPPEANGSPELAAVAPVPARLPDRESVLKATLAGMRIPGNEKAAELWNKGMGEDIAREDTQLARREVIDANNLARRENLEATTKADADRRKADLEQRERESQRRSDDTRLSIEQRAEAAREAAAARRDIATMVREVGMARVNATGDKPAKPLDLRVHKDLSALQDKQLGITEAASTFKPEYAGMGGLAKAVTGTYVPGVNTEAAEWWKNYRKNTQLTERHAMFGSALTASEKSAWRGADIEPQMSPDIVAKNLAARAKLTAKMYDRALKRYEDAGHGVKGVFEPIGEPDAPKAPTAPVKVRSQADVDKLAPGTTFIGEDGKTYRKQ